MACMRARQEPQRRSGRAGEAWTEARRESRQRQGRHHGLELDSESQEPAAGTTADPVSTVTLAVTKPAETSAAAPSADCLPADKAAAAIKEGFTSGTTYTGKAFAVKSKDYANAYMVAMSASTPESNNDALVYATPDLAFVSLAGRPFRAENVPVVACRRRGSMVHSGRDLDDMSVRSS
jgi:hypothetical protein